jgi:phosphate acetyltransferase
MEKSLFITSQKSGAGKTVIALGMLNLIKQHYKNVGIFKPLFLPNIQDKELETLTKFYNIDQSFKDIQAIPINVAENIILKEGLDSLLEMIIEKYKKLEERYDFILCLNDDTDELSSLIGKDIDVEIAKNLSTSIVGIFLAKDMSRSEILDGARLWESSIKHQEVELFVLFANQCSRVAMGQLRGSDFEELDTPIYFIPFSTELLRLTLADIMEHLPVELIAGEKEHIQHDIHTFKMGTMGLRRLIKSFKPYEFLITSTDRVDLLLGMLVSAQSANTPMNGGVLLCGEPLNNNVLNLLAGLENVPIPILYTNWHEPELIPEAVKIKPSIRITNRKKIATALSLFFDNVDINILIKRLNKRKGSDLITPTMFRLRLFERAKRDFKTVILHEIEDDRILLAVDVLLRRKVVNIKLVGSYEDIKRRSKRLGIDLSDVGVLDSNDEDLKREYAETYYELRKHKGLTFEMAYDMVSNNKTLLSTIALYLGVADGMVSGAIHSTRDTMTPALQIIKTKSEYDIASSCFFMSLPTKVLVYADCAINLNPTARELAIIAIQTAKSAKNLGIEPKVAMLSYSTGSSGVGKDVQKIKDATKIIKVMMPSIPVVGPIQYDAAIDPEVSKIKMPNNEIAGHANIFIFPDLNTGNIAYKAVQRSADVVAIGPIMQGLNKPVNDLSRGCSIEDIIDTITITAIQAQKSFNG